MPRTNVILFKDADGSVPVLDWLQTLQKSDRRGFAKCVARIRSTGSARAMSCAVPRLIFCATESTNFVQNTAMCNIASSTFSTARLPPCCAHAITKKDKVPDVEIDRAIRRQAAFLRDTEAHSHQGDYGDG